MSEFLVLAASRMPVVEAAAPEWDPADARGRAAYVRDSLLLDVMARDGTKRALTVVGASMYFYMDIPAAWASLTPLQARQKLNDLYAAFYGGRAAVMEVRVTDGAPLDRPMHEKVPMWRVDFYSAFSARKLSDVLMFYGVDLDVAVRAWAQLWMEWEDLGLAHKGRRADGEPRDGDPLPTSERWHRAVTAMAFAEGVKKRGWAASFEQRAKAATDAAEALCAKHGVRVYESNVKYEHRVLLDIGDVGGESVVRVREGAKLDALTVADIEKAEGAETFPRQVMALDIETNIVRKDPHLDVVARYEKHGKIYMASVVFGTLGSQVPTRSIVFVARKDCPEVPLRPAEEYAVRDARPNTKGEKVTYAQYLAEGGDPDKLPAFLVRGEKVFCRDPGAEPLSKHVFLTAVRELAEDGVVVDAFNPPAELTYAGRLYTLLRVEASGPVYEDRNWYTPRGPQRVLPSGHRIEVVNCGNEGNLLLRLAACIRKAAPYAVLTQNGHGFDMPMILGRAQHYFRRHKGLAWDAPLPQERNPFCAWGYCGTHRGNLTLQKNRMQSRQKGKQDRYDCYASGMLFVDTLVCAKNNFRKRRSYKLDDMCQEDFGARKTFMPYAWIDAFFFGTPLPEGTVYPNGETRMSHAATLDYLAYYCWVDTWLTLRLEDANKWINSDTALCAVTGVQHSELSSNGVGLQLFKRVLSYCIRDGKRFPTRYPAWNVHYDPKNKSYKGGLVLDTRPGAYREVVMVLDWASMYPMNMRWFNICFSTLCPQAEIPETLVRLGLEPVEAVAGKTYEELERLVLRHFWRSPTPIEFDDGWHYTHFLRKYAVDRSKPLLRRDELDGALEKLGLPKSRMVPGSPWYNTLYDEYFCESDEEGLYWQRTLRFEGILPRIEEELFNARKATRKKEGAAKDAGDGQLAAVYNALQNAFKVVMNSMYGFTGQVLSKLYLREVAATITALGRWLNESTQEVCLDFIYAKFPEKFSGRMDPKLRECIVGGDTDSFFFIIPGVTDFKVANELMGELAEIINQDFVYPVFLEAEKGMRVLLIIKKKYTGIKCDYTEDGPAPPTRVEQGTESKRRTKCRLIAESARMIAHFIARDVTTAYANSMTYLRRLIKDLCASDWAAIDAELLVETMELKKGMDELTPDKLRKQHFAWAHDLARSPMPAKVGDRIAFMVMKQLDGPGGLDAAALATLPAGFKPKLSDAERARPWFGKENDYGSFVPDIDYVLDQLIKTASKMLCPFIEARYIPREMRTLKNNARTATCDEDRMFTAKECAIAEVVRLLRAMVTPVQYRPLGHGVEVADPRAAWHQRVREDVVWTEPAFKRQRNITSMFQANFVAAPAKAKADEKPKAKKQKTALGQRSIASFFK